LTGLARWLYSGLLAAVQPLLLRKLRRRGRQEPGYLLAIGERFGRYETPATPGALWIHAVSLGETRAAAILVQALRARDPSLRLLLTHGTATGRDEGQRLLQAGDQQAWLPWDTPGAVARFLDHFRPCAGVLMETEVWPNLAAACETRGLPLALANARLSDKSYRQTMRLRMLSRPAYSSLAAVWAQTEDDAQRLTAVGARVTAVVGNLKFDADPDAGQRVTGEAWRARLGGPVLMFASSREGEELEFLREVAAHRGRGLRWLLVPRHPQRFEEVARQATQAGLTVSRRSQWGNAGPDTDALQADLWLGDTLGEMTLYYSLSDAALLGGSFAPLGGQNLIEAAACGCPILMGPHTFNFARASEHAVQAGAALRVEGMSQAVAQAVLLVSEAPRRAAMVQAAARFAQAHRGAADRTAQAIFALMERTPQASPAAVSAPAAR
jgi:3-deoxy-D-manno-octulosonic-acid transferase